VLLATLVVHLSVTVLPGDPARALFGFRPPPPEVLQAIHERFHLDDPYWVQYWLYLKDVLTFDLGTSLRTGRDVGMMVGAAWPTTVNLALFTLGFEVVLGVAGGLFVSLRPRTWGSRFVMVAAVTMIAVPVVLSTYILQGLVGIRWHLLPFAGTRAGWVSYVLPAVTLAGMTLGTVIVFLRTELRQALRAPFIAFARANGVARPRLIAVHAMRVAGPPVVTYLASNLGFIVLGILIVEGVFGLPGLGGLLFRAIRAQDRSVVVSVVMLITLVVIVLNLLADVLVAMLDPRVRAGLTEGES
jgi:ABC-type dipeptide/oligopeptide/nickel transport system permease component